MARIRRRSFLLLLVPIAGLAVFLALRHREDPEQAGKQALELAGAAKQAGNNLVRCIADDEPSIDLWQKNDESLRTIIAKHYAGLPDRLRAQCIPALEKVRGSLKKSDGVSPSVGSALAAYQEALRSAAASGERFAEVAAARDEEARGFGQITSAAVDWGSAPLPAAPAPFERFFVCAVPELPRFDDSDQLFKHFASNCLHGDPVAFMSRARRDCGSALSGGNPSGQAAGVDPLTARRFHAGPFMKLLWGGCAKDAYKVRFAQDGDELLRSLANVRDTGSRLARAAFGAPS
jgi:hypothetical protein